MANRQHEGPEAACLGEIPDLGGALTRTRLAAVPSSPRIPRCSRRPKPVYIQAIARTLTRALFLFSRISATMRGVNSRTHTQQQRHTHARRVVERGESLKERRWSRRQRSARERERERERESAYAVHNRRGEGQGPPPTTANFGPHHPLSPPSAVLSSGAPDRAAPHRSQHLQPAYGVRPKISSSGHSGVEVRQRASSAAPADRRVQ